MFSDIKSILSHVGPKMILLYNLAEDKRLEMGLKGREKMIKEYQKRLVLKAYEEEAM